jgi:hypothetical protein
MRRLLMVGMVGSVVAMVSATLKTNLARSWSKTVFFQLDSS